MLFRIGQRHGISILRSDDQIGAPLNPLRRLTENTAVSNLQSRWALSYEVDPRAFAPKTREVLGALGYRLIAPRTSRPTTELGYGTDLRLVDAKNHSTTSQVSDAVENGSATPIVLFTNGDGEPAADSRVVATLQTPIEIGSLYPVLQSALEPTPRRTPRADAELPATCTHSNQRFIGAVLSLSEQGCLFRSSDTIPSDQPLQLLFPLPGERMVSLRASMIEQNGGEVGLRFENPTTRSRRAISGYVVDQLVRQ